MKRIATEKFVSRKASLKRAALRVGAVIVLGGFVGGANVYAASGTDTCSVNTPEALVSALQKQAPTLRPEVLKLALRATLCAAQQGLVARRDVLSVIDYSLPSTEPRLFVFSLSTQRLLFRELVAHGRNSGDNTTTHFSNEPGSLSTSLGLFVTESTYFGNNGYSLRLKGLDPGFNDLADERSIVMHGAKYVSEAAAKALGRLGRSWGCPAVRSEVAQKIIDTVKGGAAIFAYYPDQQWLHSSRFLKGATAVASTSAPQTVARAN